MKEKEQHVIWYDGKKYENVTQASIQLNVTVNTIYKSLSTGFLNGKSISRYEPIIYGQSVPVHVHKAGEALIPHPVTCMISSNYMG